MSSEPHIEVKLEATVKLEVQVKAEMAQPESSSSAPSLPPTESKIEPLVTVIKEEASTSSEDKGDIVPEFETTSFFKSYFNLMDVSSSDEDEMLFLLLLKKNKRRRTTRRRNEQRNPQSA